MSADPDFTEVAIPALMRAARGAYARAIRAELAAIGAGDLPGNGAFILAGIGAGGGLRPDLAESLGVTRQAVSQAVDGLVTRGYVDRTADPQDRRRISLSLTEQGQRVLAAVVRGTEAVDARLRERMPPAAIEAMRSGLRALAEIKAADAATGAGQRRPRRQLRRFSPIFGVRDLPAALAHYAALGFTTSAYDDEDFYGYADRDGTSLHLEVHEGHEPDEHGAAGHGADGHEHGGSAYLFVADADALYAEWSRPGIGGSTEPVSPRPWGLREGSHTDPDGNLIRFGSPLDDSPADD